MNFTLSDVLNITSRKSGLNVQVNQIISLEIRDETRLKPTAIQYANLLLLKVARLFSDFKSVSFKQILNLTYLDKQIYSKLLTMLFETTNVICQILSKLISDCATIIVKIVSTVIQKFFRHYS